MIWGVLMSLDVYDKKDYSGMYRLFGFGFLVWLVPFLVSFLFFTPQGVLAVGMGFFDSVMLVVGVLVQCVLLLKYFRHVTVNYLSEAFKVGIVWLVMSLVLDGIFLVSLLKMDLGKYFTDVAIGYAAILILAFFTGYLLEAKGEHSKKIYSQIFSTKK